MLHREGRNGFALAYVYSAVAASNNWRASSCETVRSMSFWQTRWLMIRETCERLKHGLPHDRIDGLPRTFSDKTQNANVQDVEPALPLIDVIGRLASDASHALETKIHIDALDSFPFTGKDQLRSSSPKRAARSEQSGCVVDRNRAGSRSIERRSAISSPSARSSASSTCLAYSLRTGV
jgi:hypothetical protein